MIKPAASAPPPLKRPGNKTVRILKKSLLRNVPAVIGLLLLCGFLGFRALQMVINADVGNATAADRGLPPRKLYMASLDDPEAFAESLREAEREPWTRFGSLWDSVHIAAKPKPTVLHFRGKGGHYWICLTRVLFSDSSGESWGLFGKRLWLAPDFPPQSSDFIASGKESIDRHYAEFEGNNPSVDELFRSLPRDDGWSMY